MNKDTIVESIGLESVHPVHILLGPLLFLLVQPFPVFGAPLARVGFGLLVWMVYWWVTVPVDIKVTCLVPLIVAAFYPYMPVDQVMKAYVNKEAFLIFGTIAVTCAWARWGLARRLALHSLLRFGNSVRYQTVGWFLLTSVVSFVMGNTPVAAVFTPVAVASLLYAGYSTFESRWRSNAASNILIAVAWGSSAGGMTTPMGGGQAVITLAIFEKYLGHHIYFIDWTLRMLPISLCVMAAMGAFMYYFMKPEVEYFQGSREFYLKELAEMGPMTFEEKVVFFGFLGIVALALAEPVYAGLIKGSPYFKWLNPSPLFFIFATLLFFTPSRAVKGENILSIPTFAKHFPVTTIFLWPAAVALGNIMDGTGASAVVGQWLQPFLAHGDLAALSAFVTGSTILTQATSDTAAAGVMIPLVISAFKDWNGLAFGATAFIWAAGTSVSWGYALASSTGAQGIVAGYGANLKRMFVYGMIGAALSAAVTILYFAVTVILLRLDFYILPPSL